MMWDRFCNWFGRTFFLSIEEREAMRIEEELCELQNGDESNAEFNAW